MESPQNPQKQTVRVRACVCVCACVWFEDTSVYNDMGMT